MRYAELSGLATATMASALVLLTAPTVIASSEVGGSIVPSDNPAGNCAADAGNPACAAVSPGNAAARGGQSPPPRRGRGAYVPVPPLAPFNLAPPVVP
jgi:hypothetical protein